MKHRVMYDSNGPQIITIEGVGEVRCQNLQGLRNQMVLDVVVPKARHSDSVEEQ